jgi:hypothetical protein
LKWLPTKSVTQRALDRDTANPKSYVLYQHMQIPMLNGSQFFPALETVGAGRTGGRGGFLSMCAAEAIKKLMLEPVPNTFNLCRQP